VNRLLGTINIFNDICTAHVHVSLKRVSYDLSIIIIVLAIYAESADKMIKYTLFLLNSNSGLVSYSQKTSNALTRAHVDSGNKRSGDQLIPLFRLGSKNGV